VGVEGKMDGVRGGVRQGRLPAADGKLNTAAHWSGGGGGGIWGQELNSRR